jgi:hypothetical protein
MRIRREFHRILTIGFIGWAMIKGADYIPKVEPGQFSFASPITFIGGAFIAVAASHVMRRILFPGIDLRVFMRKAFEHPIGAGMVAAGICYVLATLIQANASLFVR